MSEWLCYPTGLPSWSCAFDAPTSGKARYMALKALHSAGYKEIHLLGITCRRRKSGELTEEERNMPKRTTYKTAAAIVAIFNRIVPVGTRVEYEEVLGFTGKKDDIVDYPAEVRNHIGIYAIPMVFLKHQRGCVCIDHLTGWENLEAVIKREKMQVR